jgi:NADPH:quinone reductase-like Zn-dependent oxidoreductase
MTCLEERMKAIVYTKYGPPEVLQFNDIEKSVPKADEVLIRVHATTVNRTDTSFLRGVPYFVRLISGVRRPRRTVLGSEFAGEIAAVGADVTSFKVGDRVFGYSGHFGAHAEYLCRPAGKQVVAMPADTTYEDAAAISDGAIIARSCMNRANIQSGQRVLLYGASGAIGSAALQLLKSDGVTVSAFSGTRNIDLVKSLGADAVFDYTKDDLTQAGQSFDVVFDAVGKLSFARCKSLLKPGGIYLTTDLGPWYQNPFLALWTTRFGPKRVMMPIPRYRNRDILRFKELIEQGKFKPIIDRRYPLEQIVDAYRYVEQGHKTGNVVITVGNPTQGG